MHSKLTLMQSVRFASAFCEMTLKLYWNRLLVLAITKELLPSLRLVGSHSSDSPRTLRSVDACLLLGLLRGPLVCTAPGSRKAFMPSRGTGSTRPVLSRPRDERAARCVCVHDASLRLPPSSPERYLPTSEPVLTRSSIRNRDSGAGRATAQRKGPRLPPKNIVDSEKFQQ